jgi:hypothetical protein
VQAACRRLIEVILESDCRGVRAAGPGLHVSVRVRRASQLVLAGRQQQRARPCRVRASLGCHRAALAVAGH